VFFGSIVVIYTVQGGLWAVLMTDVLQFIVLTAVVFMVAILMISHAGNLGDAVGALPEHFLEPVAGRYGWIFLAGWIAIHFFMIGAEWAFVQRFIAVASPSDARKSAWLFGAMYLATPLFWL
jgi:Na+/proline symporter